jgi:hypothetical protein
MPDTHEISQEAARAMLAAMPPAAARAVLVVVAELDRMHGREGWAGDIPGMNAHIAKLRADIAAADGR